MPARPGDEEVIAATLLPGVGLPEWAATETWDSPAVTAPLAAPPVPAPVAEPVPVVEPAPVRALVPVGAPPADVPAAAPAAAPVVAPAVAAATFATAPAWSAMPGPSSADLVDLSMLPPPAPGTGTPVAPPADGTGHGRRRRRGGLRRWLLILALLAALAAAVWFLVLPRLSPTASESSGAPVVPAATALTRPATLAGLPLITDPQADEVVVAAVGLPPTAAGPRVAGGYGTGAVSLAMGAWGTGSPDPVRTITTRVASFSDRTGATTASPVSVPVTGGTMQCVSTTAAAPLPAGALCVWSDPASTGQVWLAGSAPAKAGVVAAEVRDTMTAPK